MSTEVTITQGCVVKFLPHVFAPPYTPYYDKYRGHLFHVKQVFTEDNDELDIGAGHAEVACLTHPAIVVNGYVHTSDLQVIDCWKAMKETDV